MYRSCTFGWFIPSWLSNTYKKFAVVRLSWCTHLTPLLHFCMMAKEVYVPHSCCWSVHLHKHAGTRRFQKGHHCAVNPAKSLHVAPRGEVCSGLGLVLLWLQDASIFTLGGEQDKYVSLQHFMKQSNADIYKWDMTWSVQIVSLE